MKQTHLKRLNTLEEILGKKEPPVITFIYRDGDGWKAQENYYYGSRRTVTKEIPLSNPTVYNNKANIIIIDDLEE